MTPSPDVSPRTAIQITRASPLFDRLAEAVVDHSMSLAASRRSAASPPSKEPDIAALRERLDWFFPKFRDLYFNLLRQQIGPDLPLVLGALNDESVQRYLRALEAMQPELLRLLHQLGNEMAMSLEPL